MRLSLFVITFWAIGRIATGAWGHSPTQVKFGQTTITGTTHYFDGVGVDFFGGIPFAEPPLGNLRFAPPVALDAVNASVFDATHFGRACAQQNDTVVNSSVSEDCLTLNIFRPSVTTEDANLPVMVWIYGGSFISGQTSIYNASLMIAQSITRETPVVYVSVNYRLGPLGFPQGAEAEERGLLNLGLKDQLLGLEWVRKHVRTFGGDPSKVTIFGESAGAGSIGILYFTAGLENLVRGAIFESGSAGAPPVFNATRRQPVWDAFISALPGCEGSLTSKTSIPCAQNASTSDILAAWAQANALLPGLALFHPVIDGPTGLLPDLPSRLFARGMFSRLPFMAGTNLDEGTLFTPQDLNTSDDVITLMGTTIQPFANPNPPAAFRRDLQALLQLYPDDPALGSPFGTGNETFGAGKEYKRAAALNGDVRVQAPKRQWMRAASRVGVRAYGYFFADEHAALQDPSLGVAHATELAYVYGVAGANTSNPESVRVLGRAMVDYWLSFAVSLTPNDGKGTARTVWPPYTSEKPLLIRLDTAAFGDASFAQFGHIPDTFRDRQIAFINAAAPDFGE